MKFVDPDGNAHFSKSDLAGTENVPGFIKWLLSLKIFDLLNLELKHEHLFFDDGSGYNLGWSWGDYVCNDKETAKYKRRLVYYDDALMRKAASLLPETSQKVKTDRGKAKYSLAGGLLNNIIISFDPTMKNKVGHKDLRKNNCQDYASKLRHEYYKLYWKLTPQERKEIRIRKREIEREWRHGSK